MLETLIGRATTNSIADSVTTVKINDYICTLSVESNIFGDFLPIIPKDARTLRNKVLYQLKIKAKLTRYANETPAQGFNLTIHSNRPDDKIESGGHTNKEGEATFTLSTRDSGELYLITNSPGVTMQKFTIRLNEAWYEAPFRITGYNVCKEDDFSGPLVTASGLSDQHKDDFLHSATGVAMQGTGIASNGKYVRLNNNPIWKKNSRGNPERLEDPSSARFGYATGFHGKFADIIANHSIAIDPKIIPKKSRVEIDGIGMRVADDTGGGIRLYHIDNYLGTGRAVVKVWLASGMSGTNRRVRYLGVTE